MSIVLIPTALRKSKAFEPSGYLVVYDTEKHEIIQRTEIIEPPYRNVDPNPRGGYRGLKGISFLENRVAVANASTIFIYDEAWEPVNYFFHPTCAGFHDILLTEHGVWVTSARTDILALMDFDGEIIKYFDLRSNDLINHYAKTPIQPILSDRAIRKGKYDYRNPLSHDSAITDSLHVNSFAFLENGDLLVSCGLVRVISRYHFHKWNNQLKNTIFTGLLPWLYDTYQKLLVKEKNKFEATKITKEESYSLILRSSKSGSLKESLVLDHCVVPSHSIRILQDKTAIYLDTSSGEILHFDPITNEIFSRTKIGEHFLRGACQLPDGTLLIGDNNILIHFDLSTLNVISKVEFSEDPTEGVFDIKLLPENFSLPPDSFVKLHESKYPVHQTSHQKEK
ncbi:MAG: hypothetical protein H0S79_14935 [Anaerolineaceae bacterium]|nr:hypothetical protein [Anaerolineaceae bacterium]